MGIEGIGVHSRWLMPHADRLKPDRHDHPPTGCRLNLPGKPLCIVQVAAQARSQRLKTLTAQQRPQFQGAEPPAKRDSPVAQVADLTVHGALEVTGIGPHHPDEVFAVPHVEQGRVEDHAEPFVRVQDDRICSLDTFPERTAFGQDHGTTSHRAIHMHPRPVGSSDRHDRIDGIEGRRSCCASSRHDGAGHPSSIPVRTHRQVQCIRKHRVGRITWHEVHVLAPEPGQESGLVHRTVALRRRVHNQRVWFGLHATPGKAKAR